MAINFSNFCKKDFINFWAMIKKYFDYSQRLENLEKTYTAPLYEDYDLLTGEIAVGKNCIDDRNKINIDYVILHINNMITKCGCEAKSFRETDFVSLFDEISYVNNVIEKSKEEKEKEKEKLHKKEYKLERRYKISLILLYTLPFLILFTLIISLISILKDYIMYLVIPSFFFLIFYYYTITTKRDDLKYYIVDRKIIEKEIKEKKFLNSYNIKENLMNIDKILDIFLNECIKLLPRETMTDEKDKILKEIKNVKKELSENFSDNLRYTIFLFSALIFPTLNRKF